MFSDAVGIFCETGYQSDTLSAGGSSAIGLKIYPNIGISAVNF